MPHRYGNAKAKIVHLRMARAVQDTEPPVFLKRQNYGSANVGADASGCSPSIVDASAQIPVGLQHRTSRLALNIRHHFDAAIP